MKTSKLDKLGINVSKLGFGTMRFPTKGDDVDQEAVNRLIKYSFDNGINYYDTAYAYSDGKIEIALGKAIKQFDREKIFIADKMPFWKATTKESLDEIFNTSLERLDTTYIDFYLMHSLDVDFYKKMMSLDAINWAIKKKQEGKIKYLGFSIHDDYDCLVEILNQYDWDFAQIQYNYIDIDDNPGEKGYLELKKRGIPIIIMEPLRGGLLANLSDEIAKPFKQFNKSNANIAFRWLAEKDGIATILSGMNTQEMLNENIELFSNLEPLSAKEHDAIIEVEKNIHAYQKVKCTGCKYCMPCPFGVEIPDIFRAWNTKSMHIGSNWNAAISIDYDSAMKCQECRACTKHCPQHIDIPNMLKQVLKER